MNKDENKNSAPARACIFNSPDEVVFAADENKPQTFEMNVYNGDILHGHYFWGNLAIDLKGLKFAKKPLPVLEEHFSDKRVGFTIKQEITDKVVVKGQFVKNQGAQELQEDMRAGFPMEASMHARPSVIERVAEGESTKVNGFTLEGPGTVFRKSIIKEVSMVPMGAFDNTSSQALAANAGASEKIKFSIINEEKKTMDTEITIETFAAEHADVYQQVIDKGKADGEKAERDLFSALETACAGDLEVLVQCFKEGKTTDEALQLRSEKLETANTELKAKIAELETAKVETKETKQKVDPAETEFSDGGNKNETPAEPTKEDTWKTEFSDSKELQEKFNKVEFYVNYMKAQEKGLIRK